MPAETRVPVWPYAEPDNMPAVFVGWEVLDRPEPRWLLPDFIVEGGLTIIHSVPMAGKSVILQDWVSTLAMPGTGLHWHGRERARQARCMYVMGEGHGGLKGRLLAWQQARFPGEPVPDVHWIMQPVNLRRPEPGKPTQEQEALVEYVRENEIDVVFVDTLSATFGSGNENMQNDMNLYVETLAAMQAHGAAVVVAHHESRAGDLRGSTVLAGAADSMVRLVPTFDSNAALTHTEVIMAKLKDGIPWTPFVLTLNTVDNIDTRVGQSIIFDMDQEKTEKLLERNKSQNQAAAMDKKLYDAIAASGPTSWDPIRKAVKGNNEHKAKIRDAMVEAGYLEYDKKGKLTVGPNKMEVIETAEGEDAPEL